MTTRAHQRCQGRKKGLRQYGNRPPLPWQERRVSRQLSAARLVSSMCPQPPDRRRRAGLGARWVTRVVNSGKLKTKEGGTREAKKNRLQVLRYRYFGE